MAKVLKFAGGVPSSKLNAPPNSCIPKRAKIKMKRNRRNSKEMMDLIELSKDMTRLRREDQYLKFNVNLLVWISFLFYSAGSYLLYHETLSFSLGELSGYNPYDLPIFMTNERQVLQLYCLFELQLKKYDSLKTHVALIFGGVV